MRDLLVPTWRYYGDCSSKCPEGRPCYCQVAPGSTHSMCICSDPTCLCHARERYDPTPEPDWKDIATVGQIKFRQYLGKTGLVRVKPRDLNFDEWHDLLRAKGLETIPDSVAPGKFGDGLDLETFDNLLDLMEEDSNGEA